MSRFLDVYRGYRVPRFHLIELRRRGFVFSGVLIALSLIGLLSVGLTYSIDFKGGAQLSYPLKKDVTVQQVEATLAAAGLTDSKVQVVDSSAGREVAIRTQALTDPAASAALLRDLAKQAGVSTTDINVETIGPTWGAEISKKAFVGLLLVLTAIALYITLRFQWTMAIGAMIALLHDVLITAGVYALSGREVTPETVIAILTILGFSLYDTVVIYDKVKENTESPALVARHGWIGVVDLSLNQTIMRSVNTSLVVLLPILSLLLFGGATLKDFAFAMFVGVAIGAYSSIFIAAPILAIVHERQAARAKMTRPRGSARARSGASAAVGARRSPAPATSTSVASPSTGLPEQESVAVRDAAATSATARQGGGARPKPKPKSKRGQPAKRKRR